VNASPTVSILVPCYNYAHFLPDCLASIFALEDAPSFEVVLVDDASTDHTRELLRDLRDPRIRVICNEVNQGHARTIGIAIGAARGRFLARIDPDDRYRPNFLARTVPLFDQHPEVGLVYGDAAVINAEGQVTTPTCDTHHAGRAFRGNELVALMAENFICAPTAIARAECWRAALPVPAHLAFNDWYFTLMMARQWDFCFVPEVLADYRVHGTNFHSRIAQDGSEERSVRWLLAQLFAQVEADATREAAKQAARPRILANHLMGAAEKYFWFGNYADAQRCYLEALRADPRQAARPGVLRHLAATWLGRTRYERLKRALGRNLA
jgi:glycosyltransferase involved in cell wall biosynthesis